MCNINNKPLFNVKMACALILGGFFGSGSHASSDVLDERLLEQARASVSATEKPVVLMFAEGGGSEFNYNFTRAFRNTMNEYFAYESNLKSWVKFTAADFTNKISYTRAEPALELTKYYRTFSGRPSSYTFDFSGEYTAIADPSYPTRTIYNFFRRSCYINTSGGLSDGETRQTGASQYQSDYGGAASGAVNYPASGSLSTLRISEFGDCRAYAGYYSSNRLHRLTFTYRRGVTVSRDSGLERAGNTCDTFWVNMDFDYPNNSTGNSKTSTVNLADTPCVASVNYASNTYLGKNYGVSNSETSNTLIYYDAAGNIVNAFGASIFNALRNTASKRYYASVADHTYYYLENANLYFMDMDLGVIQHIGQMAGGTPRPTMFYTGLSVNE